MSKYKSIIEQLLTVAFTTVPEEFAELLEKSDEEVDVKDFTSKFRAKDKERIQSIKTTADDNGYKRAEKKVRSEVEKLLKEKFDIDTDKQGDELIDEIIASTEKQSGKKPGQLTDDDIKKSPLYLQLEKKFREEETKWKNEYDNKVKALEKQYSKEKVLTSVEKKAAEIFDSLNPVLSSDATKAANQRKAFIERFKGFDYEETDGEFYVIENDKRKEDEHGHAVTLSSLVKSTAEQLYDFKAEDPSKKSPKKDDGKKDDGKGKQTYTGKLPKTEAEYQAMMNNRELPLSDRKAVQEHWVSVQQGA